MGGMREVVDDKGGLTQPASDYLEQEFAQYNLRFWPEDDVTLELLWTFFAIERILLSPPAGNWAAPGFYGRFHGEPITDAEGSPPPGNWAAPRLARPDYLNFVYWKACIVEGLPGKSVNSIVPAIVDRRFEDHGVGFEDKASRDLHYNALVQIHKAVNPCLEKLGLQDRLADSWRGTMTAIIIKEAIAERLKTEGYPVDLLAQSLQRLSEQERLSLDKIITDQFYPNWVARYVPITAYFEPSHLSVLEADFAAKGQELVPDDLAQKWLMYYYLDTTRLVEEYRSGLFEPE